MEGCGAGAGSKGLSDSRSRVDRLGQGICVTAEGASVIAFVRKVAHKAAVRCTVWGGMLSKGTRRLVCEGRAIGTRRHGCSGMRGSHFRGFWHACNGRAEEPVSACSI